MYLAEDFGILLSVVCLCADSCRKICLDNLAGELMRFDDLRHIEAYREAVMRLDGWVFMRFHEAVGAQVLFFLVLQRLSAAPRTRSPMNAIKCT